MDDEDTQTNTDKQHATTPSIKGWIPKTIACGINFKNRIAYKLNTTTTLPQAINQIQTIATTIPHTTLNPRKRPDNSNYNRTIRAITAQITLGN